MNGRSAIVARALLLLAALGVPIGLRAHRVSQRSIPRPVATLAQQLPQQPPQASPPESPVVPQEPQKKEEPQKNLALPSTESNCPKDMVPVEGNHCFGWEQVCLRWDDPFGQPAKRVCAEFQKPSVCKTSRHAMRFCMDRDEYVAPEETLPAKAVSWTQADMICSSVGKRLCTNQEWEFACEGEEGLPYPYGYERSAALCNQDRLLRDGKYKAKADLREASHPTCVSPFGVRDMVGNVDEWVRIVGAQPPHRSELRGGWWMTGRNRCRANTSHHDEKYAGPQTGFRCCRDAVLNQAQTGGPKPRRTAMVESEPSE